MTARLLLRALWRQRLLAAALFLLTLISTNLYLSSVPRVYTATASVAIVPGPTQAGFGELSGPLLGTLVDQATGKDVLETAVDRVALAPSVEELRAATRVEAVNDAFTLRISVTLEDPALAAELANRIAMALPRFNLVPDRIAYRAVDVALPPTSPSAPQEQLVLAVGTLLGLALAVAGALLVDDARRRVEEGSELAELTGAPLLAQLTRPRDPRTLVRQQDAPGVDGLRSVRVGLAAAGARSSVVVAGVGAADDDGWLAGNLAVGLAEVHPRVLLVQADPGAIGPELVPASSGAQPAAGAPGLSEALRGTDPGQLVQPGIVSGLSVLTPGADPEALPALIEGAFEQLLAKLAADYDAVLVQAPALALSDDARVLAGDGRLLLWNRLGRVGQREVAALVDDLRTVRAEVVGCVAVDTRRRVLRRRRPSRRA